MKLSITPNLLLNSPLLKKSFFAGLLLWIILIIPISISSWYLLSKYETSKLLEQRNASESILSSVFSANARYGDFVNARGFILEKAKPLGLNSIIICDNNNEILQKDQTSSCPPKGEFNTVEVNGLQLQLIFNWNNKAFDQSKLIFFGLALSIILSAFFIFSSVLITYLFTLNRLLSFSNELSMLAATDGIPQFPFFPEVTPVVDSIILLKTKILTMTEENLQLKTKTVFSDIAKQVSHDIRSPLSALNMILNHLKELPESHRLMIRNSVTRINDIANTLLEKSKINLSTLSEVELHIDSSQLQVELLPAIVDTLVSEKRLQYREKIGVEIETDFQNSYGSFVKINSIEMKRVLSNLINNSCEALIESKGKITVSVKKFENKVILSIKDNGKGIPQHILQRLGSKGFTFGKNDTQSGSGIGLFHAIKTIEGFGGIFSIESTVGKGTTASITLNASTTPKWFIEKLILTPNTQIVSLDDDYSIHEVWNSRFQSIECSKFQIEHIALTSGSEFKNLVNHSKNKSSTTDKKLNSLFLIDYELLNQNVSGLQIIEEMSIAENSILVTSRYDETPIRELCNKLGIRLIPKGLVGFIPIEIEKPKEIFDLILIDDDVEIIHKIWQMCAIDKGKKN